MFKRVEGRWGTCNYLAKDEYVGRSMHYYGEYNPDETEKILSLARGTCLDIGANIGCISQALLANGFRVVAFEPQPQLFSLLGENLRDRGEVVMIPCAVGSSEGHVEMPKVQYSVKGNFGGLGIGDRSIYGTISVPVVTIDSYDFNDVGFMKVDVEGYELEVLMGARETIGRCRPVLYIEDDRKEKSAALRAYIRELGYDISEHYPTLYRENNFFGYKKNVWDRNFASHNLICMPI